MADPGTAKVLIVDDEPEICELLAKRFSIFGFPAVSCHNGHEALNLLRCEPKVQVVVSDLMMPVMSGYELLQKIKEVNSESPKFFAITGKINCSPEEIYARGADGFLHKPFDAKSMLSTIRSTILGLEDRLRHAPYHDPFARIKAKVKAPGAQGGRLFVGRGGFAFSHDLALDVDTFVGFEISAGNLLLEGHGVIRWRRPHGRGQSTLLGIELTHLSKRSMTSFLKWIRENQPLAFIPSPYIDVSRMSNARLPSAS